jgi:hypothetical protein
LKWRGSVIATCALLVVQSATASAQTAVPVVALQTERAGVAEDGLAVALQVLAEAQGAGLGLGCFRATASASFMAAGRLLCNRFYIGEVVYEPRLSPWLRSIF